MSAKRKSSLLFLLFAFALVVITPAHAQTGSGAQQPHIAHAVAKKSATAHTRHARHHGAAKKTTAAQGVKVWVNSKTGVYHYPGTRWYGATAEGRYLTESEARKEGDRAAENNQ